MSPLTESVKNLQQQITYAHRHILVHLTIVVHLALVPAQWLRSVDVGWQLGHDDTMFLSCNYK